MNPNPELIRNLWLRVSVGRLITIPFFVALGMASFSVFTIADVFPWLTPETIPLALFAYVTLLSSVQAAASIQTEINGRTWDAQRMSAIGPWAMAWGKVIGNTVMLWYAGAICLACYAFLAIYFSTPLMIVLKGLLLCIAAAYLSNAASLQLNIVSLNKKPSWERYRPETQIGGFLSLFGLLIGGFLILTFAFHPAARDSAVIDFLLLAAILYAAWATLGLYFMMRRELLYTNLPWAWLGFAVFSLAFFALYGQGPDSAMARLTRGFLGGDAFAPLYCSLVLFYGIAFADRKDGNLIRQIGDFVKQRQWDKVLHLVPRTPMTLALLLLVVFWFMANADGKTTVIRGDWVVTGHLLFAIFLFALRDMGLVFFLNAKSNSTSADDRALLYLMLLYFVLPVLVFLTDWGTAGFAKGWRPDSLALYSLFLPIPGQGLLQTLGPVLLQVAVIYALLYRRIRAALSSHE